MAAKVNALEKHEIVTLRQDRNQANDGQIGHTEVPKIPLPASMDDDMESPG